MKRARHPFTFFAASYVTQIDRQQASTLGELREALEQCSEGSIFYHTCQSLGRRRFLAEGFSNDFAEWIQSGLNRPGLAEQLAGIDIRTYEDVHDLRLDVLRIVNAFCRAHPDEVARPAVEPFHFLSSVEVLVPLGWEAWTLEEFRYRLEHLSAASFRFHFLVSRLRLRLRSNDFSAWLREELGLEGLAQLADRIDMCTETLDGGKARLLALIDRELAA
jgi:hypothetical protein